MSSSAAVRLLAPLLVAYSVDARALSARPALQQQQHQRQPLVHDRRSQRLDVIFALRGGSEHDAALPDPTPVKVKDSEESLPLPSEQCAVTESPVASCWSGVRKLLNMLLSLLSPSYEYSKVSICA
jgi:hypothetical protein